MRRPAALLAAVVCVIALGACSEEPPEPFTGQVLDPPFVVSGTALQDLDGADYSLVDDTSKPLTLVFFGYTHCPDICGLVMSNLATAMTRLDDADRDKVDVVFITTDPQRDTGPVLASYVRQFNSDFLGLTGDLDTIIEVAKPLGIGVTQGDKLPSGGYDVTHGTQVIGIDGADEAPVYWSQDTSAAELAADITQLLSEDA